MGNAFVSFSRFLARRWSSSAFSDSAHGQASNPSSRWSGASSVWRCTQRPHEQESRPNKVGAAFPRVPPTCPVTRPVLTTSLTWARTKTSKRWQVGHWGWWFGKSGFCRSFDFYLVDDGRSEAIWAMQAGPRLWRNRGSLFRSIESKDAVVFIFLYYTAHVCTVARRELQSIHDTIHYQ